MSSELVKVIVRCRPRNEKEEKLKCQVRFWGVFWRFLEGFLELLKGAFLVNNVIGMILAYVHKFRHTKISMGVSRFSFIFFQL